MYKIIMNTGREYDIEDDNEVGKLLYNKTLLGKKLKNCLVEISEGIYINPSHIVNIEKFRKMWNLSRGVWQYIK